jgi:hypothetical protein
MKKRVLFSELMKDIQEMASHRERLSEKDSSAVADALIPNANTPKNRRIVDSVASAFKRRLQADAEEKIEKN